MDILLALEHGDFIVLMAIHPIHLSFHNPQQLWAAFYQNYKIVLFLQSYLQAQHPDPENCIFSLQE